MTTKFYGYDKCDTCRKALKFLKAHNVSVESIDITTHPPTARELELAAQQLGMRKLFNTSGVVYREKKLGEKLPSMSEAEMLKLLAANGRLVKRPFLVTGNTILVGFKEPDWKTLLKK